MKNLLLATSLVATQANAQMSQETYNMLGYFSQNIGEICSQYNPVEDCKRKLYEEGTSIGEATSEFCHNPEEGPKHYPSLQMCVNGEIQRRIQEETPRILEDVKKPLGIEL